MTEHAQTLNAAASELISFRIGDQEYCVDIMSVREIRGWAPATPLPRAPNFMLGVINLRGAVLPVIDLAARLGLGQTTPTARSVIIVVRIDSHLVGLLVDAVSDILTVEDSSVQPTPDVSCDAVKSFVKGIIALDGRMISWILLDRIVPEQQAEAA
jgi:purine-binding chemotaxis protein CheW